MSARRLFAAWLIALTLFLGQSAAFAHALTHLSDHEHGIPDKACEVCVAQAQLGTGLPAAPLLLPPAIAVTPPGKPPSSQFLQPVRRAAQARAPPVFSV